MISLFDVNTVFFTLLDYPVSYLEFAGTIFNLWSVWLVARRNILTWPVGLVGVTLFGLLFYQIRLYSDLLEQVYYFVTGMYGWWLWRTAAAAHGVEAGTLAVKLSAPAVQLRTVQAVVAGTAALGFSMERIHLVLPQFFPEPASFAYLDAATTVMSFAAQLLMAHKRVESWYFWIAVDVIAIGLYSIKGVLVVAALYAVFLLLAVKGVRTWRAALWRQAGQEG